MTLKKRYRWIVLLSQSSGAEAIDKSLEDLKNLLNSCQGEIEIMNNLGLKTLAYKIGNNLAAHFISAYVSFPHDLDLQSNLQALQKKSSYLSGVIRQILLCADHKEDFSSQLEEHKGFSRK